MSGIGPIDCAESLLRATLVVGTAGAGLKDCQLAFNRNVLLIAEDS
jgi:hypothetical protein